MTEHDTTKRDVARKLLKLGLASPAEVAALANVTRQLVRYWSTDIDWRAAREARLAKEWRARMRRGLPKT